MFSPFNLASDISLAEGYVERLPSPDGDDLDTSPGNTPLQKCLSGFALFSVRLTSPPTVCKVVALDQKGGSSESQTWSFSTLNNAPRPFSLINPYNGATGVSIVENLSWEASHDPDGDLVNTIFTFTILNV